MPGKSTAAGKAGNETPNNVLLQSDPEPQKVDRNTRILPSAANPGAGTNKYETFSRILRNT